MTAGPAATLLHLGPGLGNGFANLHNARRARTPVVNIVGDHATFHKPLDAPLESDIDAVAGAVSSWLHRSAAPGDLGPDAAAAVAAALSPADDQGDAGDSRRTGTSGSVATLIVPADVSWSPGAQPGGRLPVPAVSTVSAEVIEAVAAVLVSGGRSALLLDGAALGEEGLRAASRIEQATGARIFCPTWPARLRRGAGIPPVEPLAYRGEEAHAQLRGIEHLVLAGARAPVTSFAYPGQIGELTPAGACVHTLASGAGVVDALTRLAGAVASGVSPVLTPAASPAAVPAGGLTTENWAGVVAALLPRDAIVCDESITAGLATLAGVYPGGKVVNESWMARTPVSVTDTNAPQIPAPFTHTSPPAAAG